MVLIDEKILSALSDLTEDNSHSEALVLLAVWATRNATEIDGSLNPRFKELAADAKAVLHDHQAAGHLTPENYKRRNEIREELMTLIRHIVGEDTYTAICNAM